MEIKVFNKERERERERDINMIVKGNINWRHKGRQMARFRTHPNDLQNSSC
jgi:hypothetical protein